MTQKQTKNEAHPRQEHRNPIKNPRDKYASGEAFHRVGEVVKCKWTMAVITELGRTASRPSEIQRALPGLTSKVLTDRLRKLESYGLVERHAFAEVPPRVEYTLTDRGRDLMDVLSHVVDHINRWG